MVLINSMRLGFNLFILFQMGFLTVSASFIIYNTVFPLYKRLRDEVRKRIPSDLLLDDKKLIISTPAGLHGFYLMGVAAYIKDNYDLSDF